MTTENNIRQDAAKGKRKAWIDYYEYIKSPEWSARRDMKIQEAGHRCQICNAADSVLQCHHRTYDNLGREHPSDLVVLCKACHYGFHRWKEEESLEPTDDQRSAMTNFYVEVMNSIHLVALGSVTKRDSISGHLGICSFICDNDSPDGHKKDCLDFLMRLVRIIRKAKQERIYKHFRRLVREWGLYNGGTNEERAS